MVQDVAKSCEKNYRNNKTAQSYRRQFAVPLMPPVVDWNFEQCVKPLHELP